MEIANTKTSHLVSTDLPFFVRNDHPQFIRFMEAYYEYLEQETKTNNVLNNLQKQYDIDLNETEYAEMMYSTFMKFMPKSVLADRNIIIKNIKDFYRAKGTEKATRFLFRVLYNLDIEFYYPKKDILRASDGKWHIQKSLRITDTKINGTANTNLSGLAKFVNTRITANTSGASALIERVDRFYENGLQIDELVLSGISGEFKSGELISTYFDDSSGNNSITCSIFGGIINSITIEDPGTGYSVGDPVIILSPTGNGACAIVGSVSTGSIEHIGNFGGGAGYKANSEIIITGGGGSGANGKVSTVILNEQYHPNTYNIVASSLYLEANTPAGNVTAFETFAYQNLATQWTNTSNLTVSTGAGASVTTINLSHFKANSNVFFETYDYLNVNNSIVLVTSSNTKSKTLTINPGLPGGLSGKSMIVIKKPNINSIVANTMNYWRYDNVGPIGITVVVHAGSGYTGSPTVSVVANNFIQQLGILGRMEIIDGGENYQVGDVIEIENTLGGYGFGAKANVTGINESSSNAISSVYWVEQPGFIIGGSGYSPGALPRANVQSATGNNANIQVTTILASGADLRPTSSAVGAILRILILDTGEGYGSDTTVDLTGSGDGTANVTVQAVEGLFTYPGRYLNDDGHVSSYNFIQDRDYYQNFSYVIRSAKSIEQYRKAVIELLHPAGTKLWGEYLHTGHSDAIILGDANTEFSSYYSANTANDTSPILHLNSRLGYPNTGNVWYDSSGYGNNATLYNTTFSNNYIQFSNSSNSHANVNNWEYKFDTPFSVMAWVLFSNTSGEMTQNQCVFSNWKGGPVGTSNSLNDGVVIEKTTTRLPRFLYREKGNTVIDITGTALSVNTFYMLTATLGTNDSNVIGQLYINDSLANTSNGPGFFSSYNSQLLLGRLTNESSSLILPIGNRGMYGAIGDIKIFDRDLSEIEISEYYANTKSSYGQ